MVGEVGEIFDTVKHHVDWLRNVTVHAAQLHFFFFYLLWRDVAMGSAQVQHESTDAGGALAGASIEQCSQIDLVDGLDELGDESFFCGLTDLKSLFCFEPNIFGGLDECGSASGGRNEWARITGGCDPRKSVRQCDASCIG